MIVFPQTGLRFALAAVLLLTVVYAAGAALAVPGIQKSHGLAKTNFVAAVEAPSYAPGYLLAGVWQRFDTFWYLQIAGHGYEDPRSVVFYPLYPMLIRGLTLAGVPPLWAALVIARLAAVMFLWGLIVLLSMELERAEAHWAAVWMLAWPSGFMLLAAYPESLMLAFAVWGFHFARRGQWWIAALCGAGAAVTKAAGAAVLVGLAWQCWQDRKWRAGPLALGAAGVGLYPAILFISGLPQPAAVYPAHWRTVPAWPWETLWAVVRGGGDVVLWFDVGCLVLIALLVWRKPLRPAYAAYSAALIALFLTKKTDPLLQSTMRYLLSVFPAFGSLGAGLKDPYARAALLTVLAVLHATFVFAFWMWSLVV
ncbi:MAG: hypothetical protein HY821_15705 [Acidobacteria bacterium]|nr:hypothetical protein [Acidobacteriota bacterium]